jgi:hypothetical protein
MNRPRVYGTAIGVWFLFLVVAFSLGTLRELVVAPYIGDQRVAFSPF